MKIAILGAGHIAVSMAKTIQGVEMAEAYAVASRDLKKAEAFAEQWGFEKAYGSYEEMLRNPEVELVYVATPHSHHAEHVKLCLDHGKHVLCEKAFTANAKQAREITALAREKGLLLAEAIWPRYMPFSIAACRLLDEGVIGTPRMLTANVSYLIGHIERVRRPELAGGALLDIGIYPLTFASMMFGDDLERVDSSAVLSDTGVDVTENLVLIYKDGKMASLQVTVLGNSDCSGVITGSNGFIVVDNIINPRKVEVYDKYSRLVRSIAGPPQITGYEYELVAAIKAAESGFCECSEMPHSESIYMMELMDGFREQWGVKYPFED